ncbi:hypothetical protein F5Y15DRAFT_363275 [Xylariaceae sp. FL0016]|nr:hypothetical protein F5Y15DRAFT_363275 [Xylariaceae sp. FL0016]
MGLPLFIAPVESDVPSKSTAKSSTDLAHARSPIRRIERRAERTSERARQLLEVREHRLRMLAAIQGDDDGLPAFTVPEYVPRDPQDRRSGRPTPLPRPADVFEGVDLTRNRDNLGEMERRPAMGHRDTSHSTPRFEFSGGLPLNTGEVWGQVGTFADIPPSFMMSSQRSDSHSASQRGDSPIYGGNARRPRRIPIPRESSRRHVFGSLERLRRTQSRSVHRSGHRVRYADADGLGDRDRSLSPEGDGVWDTLQSTLTPDPQPPSVGSSFASTTASATNTANSSNTSITSPDEETEPPCDPATENEGSDGEDDDYGDADGDELRTRPPPRIIDTRRRSYADVAAELMSRHSPEDLDSPDTDSSEFLSGMQRIVRGLASRQDIPDQWWAQAGLSRSMSGED